MNTFMKRLLCCLVCVLVSLGILFVCQPAVAAGAAKGPLYGVKDIAAFLPYSGLGDRDHFSPLISLGEMLADYTGGTLITYKAEEATVDNLAKALKKCAVVLIGSHGSNGTFGIRNTEGLTEEEMKSDHVSDWGLDGGVHFWGIDGTVIVNHMTDAAPHSLVVADSCMSMKTSRLCEPLLNRGVSVVLGYSETNSCFNAWEKHSAFFRHLCESNTVAEAFTKMQQEAGYWDVMYVHYSLEQAMEYGVSFPVIASEEDPYPGAGNVNKPQTVNSQWRLPVRTDTLRKIIIPRNKTIDPIIIAHNIKSAELLTPAALPAGLHYGVSGSGLLYLQGTASDLGPHMVQFKTISTNGFTQPVTTVSVMVADYDHVTVLPTANYSLTAENHKEQYYMSYAPGKYDLELDFQTSTDNFDIRIHSGSLPFSLEWGLTEYQGIGYVRSAPVKGIPSLSGYYYATPPGQYDVTFDLVTYPGGKVYRLPVRITVNAASTNPQPASVYTFTQGNPVSQKISDIPHYEIAGIEITGGSLPKGLKLLNSPDYPIGLYGVPEETGEFTLKVRLTGYNNIYDHTLKISVVPAIRDVQVLGLKLPKAGETCTMLADLSVPADAHYQITAFGWKDEETDSYESLPFSFKAGKKYKAQFKVETESGYGFAVDENGDPQFDTLSINGEESLVLAGSASMDGDSAMFFKSVTLCDPGSGNEIRDVRISGFSEPADGEDAAALSALSVPADVHYKIDRFRWFNGETKAEIPLPFQFQAGKSYYAQIYIKADSGWAFAFDGTQAPDYDIFTLNGGTSLIKSLFTLDSVTGCLRTVTFNVTAAPATWTVTVTTDGGGTASANPVSGAAGTEVILTAAPGSGSHFKAWQVMAGGVTVTDNKFTIGTANVEIKALFEADSTVSYSFTKGSGAVWVKGSGTTLHLTVKGSPDDTDTFLNFTGIQVDGADLDSGRYTASAGSVNIGLKADYLETLSEGSHTITAAFANGSVSASFTVKAAAATAAPATPEPIPKTGDSGTPVLWIGLVLLGLAMMAVPMAVRIFRKSGKPERRSQEIARKGKGDDPAE